MSELLYNCMTKAVISDGDCRTIGPQWITSRRARLKLFAEHLTCGDWTLEYDEFENAELASFRTPLLRIPGYILTVRTSNQAYHFGVNGGSFWNGDLPFPVSRTKGQLQMSWVSIVARMAVFAGVAILIWQWLN